MAILKKKAKGPQVPTVKFEACPENEKSITNNTSPYASHGFCFAPCTRIEKGATQQVGMMHSCREGLISSLVTYCSNSGNSKMYDKLATSKATIMVWTYAGKNNNDSIPAGHVGPHSTWIEASMKAGLRLVNHFERENNWLTSKLYRAVLPKNSGSFVYVVEGSRWWLTSPHTLSLMMLLIRLGKRAEIKALKKDASTQQIVKTIVGFHSGLDYSNAVHAQKWPVLLKNRRAIYKDRKFFAGNFAKAGGGGDGIRVLTRGGASDKTVQNRFDEFCSKAKV